MTREDHLLVRAMEECAEVAQRISKALVFGLDEIQPGQSLTNRQRIYQEYFDLRAVLGMAGIDAWINDAASKAVEAAKIEKVEHYLAYSESLGRVTE
jgi:hypothetical protein